MWGNILGSPYSERNRRQLIRSARALSLPAPPPAPTEVGPACLRLLRGSPRWGRVCQFDWGPEKSRTYVGLKAGGEIHHSRTPTVATTSAAGGESIPELPNGRYTPSRPRASERALSRTRPFLPPVTNQELGCACVPPPHAVLRAESGRIPLRMIPPSL